MAGGASSGAVLVERRGGDPAGGPGGGERPGPAGGGTAYEVVIIGAGPAGYTAGVYCSRARRRTLILSGLLPGGQLVNTTEVENYPGFPKAVMGPDLMADMREQAKNSGASIVDEEAVNVDLRRRPFKVLTASEEYEADAVIIATGASPRKLGLDGEEALAGKGVSYCATCDGPFFRGAELAVVGGGDSAMEEATFLTKFASAVHVVHRRDELRASRVMQERARGNAKIRMHMSCEVKEIRGGGRVESVTLRSSRTGEESELRVGGVFVAIGHDPNTAMLGGQVETDGDGYVALRNGTAMTSVEGVFAAGDVHDRHYKQAVTAAGYGCMAALEADRHLTERRQKGA